MLALVLLGFVTAASTAAWHDPYDFNNDFQNRMDTFWENFDQKMNNLNKKIKNVVKHAKNRESTSRIDGNEYKTTIHLTGFNKEDIVVSAEKRSLIIRAVHNVRGEPVNNYLYVTNLPDFVDENGSWSYNNGILTIVFPIIHLKSDDKTLPYFDDVHDDDKDPDENVMTGYITNSYDSDKSQTTSDPSQYDYEDAIQPETDVDENS